eukprot:GFUD01008826.1.p1 GENE.GFUD01008826.1~~GFUD01008826.1.p1  ORF type:complete len:233 (-),score=36.40 GFUD01008826.1:101-799(-)
MDELMKRWHLILCFLLIQFIIVNSFWLKKHEKNKSKYHPNRKNSIDFGENSLKLDDWKKYEKKPKSRKICKSGKFTDKLKMLYKCKDYSPKKFSIQTAKLTLKHRSQAKCNDDNIYCATWASLSECTANPSWMFVHCPIACDQCNIKCDNFNNYCEEWARAGECYKNREYMGIYCKKSCSLCSTSTSTIPSTGCQDSDTNCDRWGRKGFCNSEYYRDFMRGRCKKTCRTCPV